MKLTRYGMREWLGSGIFALFLLAVSVIIVIKLNQWLGICMMSAVIVCWLSIAAFFRVPRRNIPSKPTFVLAPADGVIQDVGIIKTEKSEFPPGQDMVRIGIFLSVLDVHVNRVPADMLVTGKLYKPGKYLDARHPNAARDNESMLISGTADVSGLIFNIGVRQISGAIARCIVCPVEPGNRLQKGQIYGMIKFGSRTELYLPIHENIVIKAKAGNRVYAGTSVLAEIIN